MKDNDCTYFIELLEGLNEMKCLAQCLMCGKWPINVWDDGDDNDDEDSTVPRVKQKYSSLDSWVPKAILL